MIGIVGSRRGMRRSGPDEKSEFLSKPKDKNVDFVSTIADRTGRNCVAEQNKKSGNYRIPLSQETRMFRLSVLDAASCSSFWHIKPSLAACYQRALFIAYTKRCRDVWFDDWRHRTCCGFSNGQRVCKPLRRLWFARFGEVRNVKVHIL